MKSHRSLFQKNCCVAGRCFFSCFGPSETTPMTFIHSRREAPKQIFGSENGSSQNLAYGGVSVVPPPLLPELVVAPIKPPPYLSGPGLGGQVQVRVLVTRRQLRGVQEEKRSIGTQTPSEKPTFTAFFRLNLSAFKSLDTEEVDAPTTCEAKELVGSTRPWLMTAKFEELAPERV